MAKRRAEGTMLFETSSKKPFRLQHAADPVLQEVSVGGGVCPRPGSGPERCRRKRPYHFTDSERKPGEAASHHGTNKRKNPEEVLTVEISGRFQNRTSHSPNPGVRKRAREEQVDSGTSVPEAAVEVSNTDSRDVDGGFNSFQFWRTPLQELDPSLLEELSTKHRTEVKSLSPDAMET